MGRKIDRILELRPGNPDFTKLSELCVCFNTARQKRLAQGEYRQAVELLEDAPQFGRDAAFHKVYESAAELKWLSDDIRFARKANATLVGVAQQTRCRQSPRQTCSQWPQCAAQVNGQSHATTRLPWAPPSNQSQLGAELHFWTGKHLNLSSLPATSPFHDYASDFAVATGLALQGLELAPLQLNLVEEKKPAFD